jgi:hypothetical protein
VPQTAAGPVRYVSRLPPASVLEGQVRGPAVSFLKRYQGDSFGGYRVGDQLVGMRRTGHGVHYEGRLSPDGNAIEGRWWIDPTGPGRRTEGLFTLRRHGAGTPPPVDERATAEPARRPWWPW